MTKILLFTQWSENSSIFLHFKEVYDTFFEILFEKTALESGKSNTASLDDWYHLWAHILHGAKGMSSFPVWLRMMPRMIFELIDRKGDGVIDEEELLDFYKQMLRVQDDDLGKHTKEALKYMK